MATTEEAYNKQMSAATGTDTTSATGSANPTTGTSLDSYNQKREQSINQMYDSALTSQKTQLENAYNQNLSNMQADREKLGGIFQGQKNDYAANYERQRRNNNLQAAANGLNTGAGSQMRLASSNAYQSGMASLGKAQAEAEGEADRNITNLQATYQSDIQQAMADNDSQRMAALLDEYSSAYDRTESYAKTIAAAGDFTGYALLFGDEAANNMKSAWIAENPLVAYNTGNIDANRYFQITGKYPPGYTAGAGGGGGGSSSGGGWYDANGRFNPYAGGYTTKTQQAIDDAAKLGTDGGGGGGLLNGDSTFRQRFNAFVQDAKQNAASNMSTTTSAEKIFSDTKSAYDKWKASNS